MREKIDGQKLPHFGYAEDIVLITSNISKAERMLADFDKAYGKIGLRRNLTKNDVHEEAIGFVRPIHAQRK
uniref:Reverse transcriptase domain-containing protein n=1 Tax=Angiostrongylus cantonensis TaxID=6313 RepID=A0A0K0DM67_ANGCA